MHASQAGSPWAKEEGNGIVPSTWSSPAWRGVNDRQLPQRGGGGDRLGSFRAGTGHAAPRSRRRALMTASSCHGAGAGRARTISLPGEGKTQGLTHAAERDPAEPQRSSLSHTPDRKNELLAASAPAARWSVQLGGGGRPTDRGSCLPACLPAFLPC
jgi:hypothetical protein